MEGAAKCRIVQELAGYRLESPIFKRTHCCGMMRINDDALLVHHTGYATITSPADFRFSQSLGEDGAYSSSFSLRLISPGRSRTARSKQLRAVRHITTGSLLAFQHQPQIFNRLGDVFGELGSA